MVRLSAFIVATAVAFGTGVTAQPAQQGRRSRQDVARAQGVPPGQLPPANECRVWYDDRSPGRQPSATTCARAEATAARDRDARVIYGEDAYWDARAYEPYDDSRYPGNDRGVRRGSVRDPRMSGGTIDQYGREGTSVAFRNGYRDGMTKGREDAEDGDRYDVNRHSWYRSANRGYESELGTRYTYIDRYRRGFESGYSEGYRVYTRR
jgi:hypothetical protein